MHIRRWALALFITVGTIAGLSFLKFQQVQAAIAFGESFPEPSATVQTTVTKKESFSAQYKVTGQARALQVVALQNQLSGNIVSVNFNAGDIVEAGQVLLSLDTSEEEAQLNAAKATFALAKSTLERNRQMLIGKKVSQQVVDSALADYQIAIANIDNLNSIINKKQVIAPFRGRVGIDTFEVGQFLPNNSPITTLIAQSNQIWVEFKLPQTKTRLAIGDQVWVEQINQHKTNPKISAKVVAKQTQMEANSRHQTYRVVLDNSDDVIAHNELLNIYITQPAQSVIMVPNLAITRTSQGDFVYQLRQDDTNTLRAHKLAVELGPRLGDNQAIISGLESNMLIATIGAFKLSQGLLVYPQTSDTDDTHVPLTQSPEGL
ncbi:hypothetical protein PULV_b0642 [Pseudoalteromonas ulvae UL12]|uniref:efflux RND transporter periplasmic adaptor subunit n=1 Tax=Pseudoalteromonas ulvae TaxID=107327 RepID=UPI00186BB0B6|nr:efflux RND transporter periplasmic adaptor subunit [Pseudoalteromonas ulvae]MBE0365934.1 hypothetical protein [Pseudoalteromonas ulvae UL12]